MHFPHIVDNASACPFSDRYGRFVILPIKIHEVSRSIIPTAARHVPMAGVFVYYRFFAFGGHLHQFVNMRGGIGLSLERSIAHGSPVAGVVVAQLPCRGSCKQEDVPVFRNELDILSTADFTVDVVLQLLTPAVRVTAKQNLTVCLHILFPVACLSDGLPALRRSGLLHRPPIIPGGVHQGVVPNLLQLPGVLHHGAALRAVRLQALQSDLQVFHPFPQPVPDLFRQAAVFLCQLLHHRAVPQHHLAGVSYHLVHGLVVLKARLPALLVRHQILKAHALLMGQLVHHEGLQRLILGAVGLDEVGQLVGGGLQDGRLGHAHGVPPGVDVQVQLAVLVKAVGALVYAPLVGLALIEYHVNAHRPGEGPHGLHRGPLAAVHGLPVHRCIGLAAHLGPSQAHRAFFLCGAIRSPAGAYLLLTGLHLALRGRLALLVGQLDLRRMQVVHAL